MVARTSLLCILAAALFIAPGTALAQTETGSQRTTNAAELDPEDPRSKRAAEIVKLLSGKDAAQAQTYLKTHAVPQTPASADIPKLVKDLQATLAPGFVIDRFLEGPDEDVVVMLNSASGGRGGRMALIVQVEKKAPHRIRDVKPFEGRRRQGGL